MPPKRAKLAIDGNSAQKATMTTRGKKISLHHILGIWSGFIPNCQCEKCNELQPVASSSSVESTPQLPLLHQTSKKSARSDSEIIKLAEIEKIEPITDEPDPIYFNSNGSEDDSSNIESIDGNTNSNNNVDPYLHAKVPLAKDAKIDSNENSLATDNVSEDDLGIEVANAEFDIDHDSDNVYTAFRRNVDDPLNYVECSVCFKKIKESSMKQHFKTHSGVRPHRCDICGTYFTRRGDVCRHKRVVHGKVRPYVCRKCNKKFPDRTLLVSHLVNHDKTTFYECSVCNFKFGRREYFDNHIRFIHPSAEQVNPSSVAEDAVEIQLKELEEEDEITGANTVASAIRNAELSAKTYKQMPEIKATDICKDLTDFSAPIPLMQLQTVSKDSGKDEDLVGKILNAAVAQATNTLSNLAAVNPARTSFKSNKRNNKYGGQSPLEIIVKVSMNGTMRRFILQIQGEEEFDLQSAEGMDLIVKLINELGEDKGQVDGPIQIELYKPPRRFLLLKPIT
ncbi:zinc finger protein Aiolos [Hyalella azteca]|uniref:Zinc finger protein Aiolos n=1 Tax=Hyalella azteca TaxID=294128 RepID=A0A8B7NV18_HYAAZ|nr:zinc finger protein Aiolos [Hyalella azteca]